jgi:hypothetical protein
MNARRPISKLQRRLYLSAAAAFCFFLIASAPHRVHHFFEQLPGFSKQHAARAATHEHTGAHHGHDPHDGDHGNGPGQKTDCPVLSAAQNAHASIVQSFGFAFFDGAVTHPEEPLVAAASVCNLAPRSQRAPPLA